MYEIRSYRTDVDGEAVQVYERDVFNCNVLTAYAGTEDTDPEGDDRWSLKTVFGIRDNGSTNWDIYTDNDGFRVELRGVAEQETVIRALEFILRVLKDERDGVHD